MEDELVPHNEGPIVFSIYLGRRYRGVVCPICGKMEHAPDIGQANKGEIVSKVCESYGYKFCEICENDVCKNYKVRGCEKIARIRYRILIGGK